MSATDLAQRAWCRRWQVELDAALRFSRLAGRLSSVGAVAAVVRGAESAAEDETRHAAHCETLARRYGYSGPSLTGVLDEIAPASLGARERVLYETVAACCVTETESVAVLTSLLAHPVVDGMHAILRELARDEVDHSRLGWTHLATEAARGDVSFLGPHVPAMLAAVGGDGFFGAFAAEEDDAALWAHGVIPRREHQAIFRQTAQDVVFPGLEQFGVSTEPARKWLAEQG